MTDYTIDELDEMMKEAKRKKAKAKRAIGKDVRAYLDNYLPEYLKATYPKNSEYWKLTLQDIFTVTDKPVEEARDLAKSLRVENPALTRKEANKLAREQLAKEAKAKEAEETTDQPEPADAEDAKLQAQIAALQARQKQKGKADAGKTKH